MDLWRTFDSATLEAEYSPSSMIGGNYRPYIEAYVQQSAQARARLSCRRDLRYGPGPRALIDYFPSARGDAPLLVFIHGGYWQELSKNESSLLAPAWVEAGYAHAVLDYDLAPEVSLEHIVNQCEQALAWLQAQAAQLGFDPSKIVLAGSSAGAHLVAMLCLRCSGVKGAVLLSGIYDLEPLVPTYVNQALGLSVQRALDLSPQHLLSLHHADRLKGFPKVLVAWGEHETLEFKRQSKDFSDLLSARGAVCEKFEVAGRNHFDIVNELGLGSSVLFQRATGCFEP